MPPSPLSVSTLQANRTEGEGKRVFIADIGRGPLFFQFKPRIFQRKDAVILLLIVKRISTFLSRRISNVIVIICRAPSITKILETESKTEFKTEIHCSGKLVVAVSEESNINNKCHPSQPISNGQTSSGGGGKYKYKYKYL